MCLLSHIYQSLEGMDLNCSACWLGLEGGHFPGKRVDTSGGFFGWPFCSGDFNQSPPMQIRLQRVF